MGAPRITREQAETEGWFEANDGGLCLCGCGQPAPRAPVSTRKKGMVCGEFVRYVAGHNTTKFLRRPNYKAVHEWLRRNYPKSGSCEECGESRYTEHANVSGRYLRDRGDYRELCKSCHRRFDGVDASRARA